MNHLEFTWRGAEQPKMQLSSHSLASWHLLTPKVHLPQISFLSPGIQKGPPLSFFYPKASHQGKLILPHICTVGNEASGMVGQNFFEQAHIEEKQLHGWASQKYLSYTTYTAVPVAWLGRWVNLFRWAEQICALPSVVTSWPAMCIAFGCLFFSKMHSAFCKWFSLVLNRK